MQVLDSKGLCTAIDPSFPVSRQKKNVTPSGGGDLILGNRDGAQVAHEPAELAAPPPLAAVYRTRPPASGHVHEGRAV